MTLRHRIRFYQQLAVLARAGVPLRSSLQRLEGRVSGPEVGILSERISAGDSVSDAFTTAKFSPFECNLVAAGERSARLEVVFQHLGEFWSRQAEMFQALLRPIYYPVAVLHLSIAVGALVEYFSGSIYTVIAALIWRFTILYAGAFILYTLVRVSWISDAAQRFWLALPLIGSTLSTSYAYRWITALRIEFSAGVPLPDAVADAWRATGFAGRDKLAREGELSLREGTELSVLVQHWRRLPRDWVDFIETGEISGSLETALENLEAEAGRAWNVAQQRMTDWLPKMLYFVILLITAVQIFSAIYQVVVVPLNSANQEIENALNGK